MKILSVSGSTRRLLEVFCIAGVTWHTQGVAEHHAWQRELDRHGIEQADSKSFDTKSSLFLSICVAVNDRPDSSCCGACTDNAEPSLTCQMNQYFVTNYHILSILFKI